MTAYAYYYKYSEHSQSSQGSLFKGSSLNFSAHGWWGREKNANAEKSVRQKFSFSFRPRKNTAEFPPHPLPRGRVRIPHPATIPPEK